MRRTAQRACRGKCDAKLNQLMRWRHWTVILHCADVSSISAPGLLLIDEVGYLSYSNRHADLLFELISRRYEHKSTVITTNRLFKECHEVFPNAACVVSLIDGLVHCCAIVAIEGESYRLKEAKARAEQKATTRTAAPRKAKKA